MVKLSPKQPKITTLVEDRIERLERMVLLITDRLPLYKETYSEYQCLGCQRFVEKRLIDMFPHEDDCPVKEIEQFRAAINTD